MSVRKGGQYFDVSLTDFYGVNVYILEVMDFITATSMVC